MQNKTSVLEEILVTKEQPECLRVGQKVWTNISIGGISKRMAQGEIVTVHSGYCDVDIMSLHGGSPWIVQQANTSLEISE